MRFEYFEIFSHHHHVLVLCNSLLSANSLSQAQLCCSAGELSLIVPRRGPAHSFDPVLI